MSFGANLKRERELRGITLEEIARETKIGLRMLSYMEADRFDLLPPGIFRQSFIRSYARYLGIDEGKAVQEYLMTDDRWNTADVSPGGGETKQASTGSPPKKSHPSRNRKRTVLSSSAALLGVLAIFYFVETRARTDQAELNALGNRRAEQPSAKKGSTAGASSQAIRQPSRLGGLGHQGTPKVLGELAPHKPAGTAEVAKSKPTPDPQLSIKAREQTWVTVSAEGTTLFSGLLRSDETKSFSLQQPLSLRLSNPKRVALSVNDQSFGELGEAGKVKTIVVSAENYQRFLAATE